MSELTRRDVLAAAGALTLSRVLPQEKPVGWAILGLGGYALNQIMPAMKDCKSSKLVAVISGTPDKARRVADQYGLPEKMIYNYGNMDSIRDNPEIEVVYVITPPGTHRDFTVRSLRAGKHVCCEKPMANTSAECQEMIDEAKKANRLLQIGYRSHYQAHNRRAIEACRSGELGTLRSVFSDHGFNMRPGTWRTDKALAGGGALWDIGIYSIQAVRYLAGADPVKVTALGHRLSEDRFKEIDDVMHMAFEFPNGVIGSAGSGYSWSGASFMRAIGTRGRLDAEPATPYAGHRLVINGMEQPITPNNQFAEQMDDLSNAIRRNGKVLTPGEMGLFDIRVCEAALRSAREGRTIAL